MARYAIGDIQGCFETLERLLDVIAFDARRDELWLVGDLVNRGPRSLDVLRWARDLGDRAKVVLGNHDIHLVARAAGLAAPKRRDTLEEVLAAPDRDELVTWLASRPVLHRDGPFVLVHAGLLPRWTVTSAEELARELEGALTDPERRREVLARSYEARPWDDALAGADRWSTLRAVFTALRTIDSHGVPCLEFTGPPDEAPLGCVPWFDEPSRKSRDATIVFGHWAALGLLLRDDVVCVDTGCVWGGKLTAVSLEDRAVFQVDAVERRA